MFQICVVGCGGMSSSVHGPSFVKYQKEYPDVRLAGCCDLDLEKAESYAAAFGFERVYTNFEQMLREIQPNVVSLVSPVQVTCDLAVRIIKLGYNVILEKPPGLNSGETRRILAAAEEMRVAVRTAFNRRYTPLVLKLKELLCKDGGPIYHITYQMYRHHRLDPDFSTTAIHAIDAAKYLVGADYLEADAVYQEHPAQGEGVANFFLNCIFENGAIGQLSIIPLGGTVCERVTINTPGYTYLLEQPLEGGIDGHGRLRKFGAGMLLEDMSTDGKERERYIESGFYEENRSFFELLRAGNYCANDLGETLQSVEIANCLRERKPRYVKEAAYLAKGQEDSL